MKNRIEELKKQCTNTVHSHGAFGEYESYKKLDVDKFAEEIIKECAHIAWLNTDMSNDANQKILKNFGVK